MNDHKKNDRDETKTMVKKPQVFTLVLPLFWPDLILKLKEIQVQKIITNKICLPTIFINMISVPDREVGIHFGDICFTVILFEFYGH